MCRFISTVILFGACMLPWTIFANQFCEKVKIEEDLYSKLSDIAVKYGDGSAALHYYKLQSEVFEKQLSLHKKAMRQDYLMFKSLDMYVDEYNCEPKDKTITSWNFDGDKYHVIFSNGQVMDKTQNEMDVLIYTDY